MRKQKKIKQIVSRPVKSINRVKARSYAVAGKTLHDKELTGIKKGVSRLSDFNLEAEAARIAYRNGLSTESGDLYRVRGNPDLENNEEFETVADNANEKEVLTGGDRDALIEKLRRRIHSEEKEGWEAFYN